MIVGLSGSMKGGFNHVSCWYEKGSLGRGLKGVVREKFCFDWYY